MVKKEYWVSVSNDSSTEYIENHFKYAKVNLVRIKGKSFNMYLTYNEKDSDKVQKELEELVKYKIIEFGL